MLIGSRFRNEIFTLYSMFTSLNVIYVSAVRSPALSIKMHSSALKVLVWNSHGEKHLRRGARSMCSLEESLIEAHVGLQT